MSLRKNLIFGGLLLFFVFYVGSCSLLSEEKNQNSLNANQNKSAKTGDSAEVSNNSAKQRQTDNQPQTVSQGEIQQLKSSLDTIVKQIPSLEKKKDVGPIVLGNAHEICQQKENKILQTCITFSTNANQLIGRIVEYCQAKPKECKESLDAKNSAIYYFNQFCNDKYSNSYTNCLKLKQSVQSLDTRINNQGSERTPSEESTPTPTSTLTPTPTPTPAPEGIFGNVGNLLLYAAGGILGLALLGGIGWLGYSFFTGAFDKERKINDQNFRKASSHAHSLDKKIKALEDTVKLQSGQFTQMQTAIKSLQRQMSDFSGQSFQEEIFAPPVKQPEPKFPVLAEDYLEKNSANAQTATADLIGGLLVNDLSKGNEFLIVEDNELEDGLSYAVPNQPRFNTKAEYFNYFQTYYKFENPSSGAIWIKIPALVRRTEGGWKLVQPGNLEVR